MRPVLAFITKAELESRNGLPLVNGIFVSTSRAGNRGGFDRCISTGSNACGFGIDVCANWCDLFLYRLYLFSRCVEFSATLVTVFFDDFRFSGFRCFSEFYRLGGRRLNFAGFSGRLMVFCATFHDTNGFRRWFYARFGTAITGSSGT